MHHCRCVHACITVLFQLSSWQVAHVCGIESDTKGEGPSLRSLLLILETIPGLNKMLKVFLEFEEEESACGM